jgi:glycosyltransferase involved in cell wall biosynthesis
VTTVRIGIDYRSALHARDGIARYTRELVRALAEPAIDAELVLFGSTWREPPPDLQIPRGARLLRRRIPSRLAGAWMSLAQGGADRWLGGVDVFHHTQAHVLPVRDAAEVATLHDCIYVETPELVEPRTARRMTASARRALASADAVIVPSEFTRGQLARCFAVDPDRVHVVPLGVDHGAAPEPESHATGRLRYVLTVARIERRKNPLTMLRAFERLVRTGFDGRWILAGKRGFGAEEFDEALARSSARARVEVRGEVGEAELAALYAHASAFLFLSRVEGFGLPPLEALAAGVPTVVAAAGSLPETCGGAALLVAPDDDEGAAAALERVLGDAACARELSARGRERAAAYSWRRCAEATLAVYRATCASRRAK